MYPYRRETDREELIALIGITEVAEMEIQYHLTQFFAQVPAMFEEAVLDFISSIESEEE